MSARPRLRLRARPAFTLIEVMIALVMSGIVASLAYSAAQAGFDTDARVVSYRDGLARDGVVRALLSDALRHQVDGVRGGLEVFTLADRVDADGRDADSLSFVTRGVESPMGASATWRLAAWREGHSLRIAGVPLDGDIHRTPPFVMSLDDVTAFDVRVLGRGLSARWRDEWPDADQAPDAFALRLDGVRDRANAVVASEPWVVRRGLERSP